MARVAIVGGGKMGEALLGGFTAAGHQVAVVESDADRAAQLRADHGEHVVVERTRVAEVDAVVLATKPAAVVAAIADLPITTEQLVVSIAAGISIDTIVAKVPAGTDVVRVMPNTPAFVGEGMSVLSASSTCSPAGLALAKQLLACVGEVAVVAEADQDAVTALSGSGPAYIFLVVEAMTDAGVELGLDRMVAEQLAIQTAVGAAKMLRDTGHPAATLREHVTSPGGTTAAALAEFERRELRKAFWAAMRAARERSRELGSV